MARSRNIKPGFFKNEVLADTGMAGRLLFAGLWTLADREGRMEDRPRYIKAEIFPYDNVDIDSLLDNLHASGFINRYEIDGERYISIVKWHKHQNPHVKEADSTIPPPLEHQTSTVQAPCNNGTSMEVAVLIPDSLNLIPDSLHSDSSASAEVNEPAPLKPLRPPKLPDEDAYTYALTIAKAAGYPNYTNKDEACRHAKAAMKQGVACAELVGCVGYMLETNGVFWATKTLSIPSAIRQLPAYRKATANGWTPGQKGQTNGRPNAHQRTVEAGVPAILDRKGYDDWNG